MNEGQPLNGENHNDFPLVRRPSSAVEKAAPGAKRILSGMVGDTLALVKKTRPRIVVVDDEPMLLQLFEILILQCFKDATVLSFDNGDQAWQELLRKTPDLLVTDMNRGGLNGWKMLPLLAAKKVNFPILVASGSATEKDVRQCAGSDLTFSFLAKPFSIEAFHHELLKYLAGKVLDLQALFTVEDVVTQFNLGYCYQNGFGVAKDDAEAAKWYRKSAEQGNAKAQYRLGRCYDDGTGVPKNLVEAAQWYYKSAEQGFYAAQFMIGHCLMTGEGVPQNMTEGVKWYRKSAEQGGSPAQINLATCYRHGQGVPQNMVEAANWYHKAAEQNMAEAQSSLGDFYRRGEGVLQDYTEAVKWYRKAAEQGVTTAQNNLGVCYEKGLGVPKDQAEADKWFRKAAEQKSL
jgi:TPR repeat protein